MACDHFVDIAGLRRAADQASLLLEVRGDVGWAVFHGTAGRSTHLPMGVIGMWQCEGTLDQRLAEIAQMLREPGRA